MNHFSSVNLAVWQQWGSWSRCSVTCNIGVQIRERACLGINGGGQGCVGDFSETRECSEGACSPGMLAIILFVLFHSMRKSGKITPFETS